MRTLVTGGAGLIGSNLVDRLTSQGHDVTVVDDLSRGRTENLGEAGKAVRLVQLDVQDPGLSQVMAQARPEVVFHLAAQIDVRARFADPALDARINILGTINVAEAARRAGVRKIVFTSSGGSIYGAVSTLPVSEDAPINPLSPYAVSKISGELYLNAVSQLYGLECTHWRWVTCMGPAKTRTEKPVW